MSVGKTVLHALSGIVLVHALHQLVVSLGLESVRYVSDISVVSTKAVHPVGVLSVLLGAVKLEKGVVSELHVFFVTAA